MNWGRSIDANASLDLIRPGVDDLLGTFDVRDPLILTYSMFGKGNSSLLKASNLIIGYAPHVSLAGTIGLLSYCAINGHTNLAFIMGIKTATSLHNIPSMIYRSIDRPHSIGNPTKSLAAIVNKVPFVDLELESMDDKWFMRNLFIMDQKYSTAVGLPHAYAHYAMEREGISDPSLRRGISHASDHVLHRGSDLEKIADLNMSKHLSLVRSRAEKSSRASRYAAAMHLHEKDKGSRAFDEVLLDPKSSVDVADDIVEFYWPKLA